MLYNFALTEDTSLQNMLLELILRSFSQRSNLIRNLEQVNLFATDFEVQIFSYFTNLVVKLRDYIQRSDSYLSTANISNDSVDQVLAFRQLIANLTLGLLKGSKVSENQNLLFSEENSMSLSANRQSMMNNLNIHEIVISFIQKKFSIVERIVESDLPKDYKKEVLELFKDCFTFLIFFCKGNYTNQCILYSTLEETLGNLKYELGQIDLICAVKWSKLRYMKPTNSS